MARHVTPIAVEMDPATKLLEIVIMVVRTDGPVLNVEYNKVQAYLKP